jgi:hypothetical protein
VTIGSARLPATDRRTPQRQPLPSSSSSTTPAWETHYQGHTLRCQFENPVPDLSVRASEQRAEGRDGKGCNEFAQDDLAFRRSGHTKTASRREHLATGQSSLIISRQCHNGAIPPVSCRCQPETEELRALIVQKTDSSVNTI